MDLNDTHDAHDARDARDAQDVSDVPPIARPWVEGRVTIEGRPVAVEQWLETHTAVVIVARDQVYKIRKAVDLGYVSHTTPASRHEATLRELELGRRFSPHAYVGAWTLTIEDPPSLLPPAEGTELDGGEPGPGETVLVMKRLPDHLRADRVMKQDVGPERLQTAVDQIVRIHESLPVDREPEGWGAPERVKAAWANEFKYLPTGNDNGLWTDKDRNNLSTETAGWLDALAPTLLQRIADGRVRECHGDLRLEHCYLTEPLSIIDPLEFAIEHRFSDVAAEIGFLAMELDEIRRVDAGAYALGRYAALTGDRTLEMVSPFFKRYRAVIRAKVEWIRAQQTSGDRPRSADHLRRGRGLIELAASYRLSPPAG